MNARQLARLILTATLATTVAAGGLTTDIAAPAGRDAGRVQHMVEAVHEGETGTLTMNQSEGATASAKKSSPRGYTLLGSNGVALPTGGLTVVIDPRAPHRATIAKIIKTAIAAEAKGGLSVRWGGYATTVAKGAAVVINEQQGGCTTNVLAVTGVSYVQSGKTMVVGSSTMHVCKRLIARPTATQRAALFHEMGHAVGLAHFNAKYGSKNQIMNATVQPKDASYQKGDLKGLSSVAARTRASH